MRWRRWRSDWSRPAKPMVERLGTEQQAALLRKLTAEIKRSPLLAGLDVQVRSGRGRFYVERRLDQGPELWARITPLAEGGQLLLERERRQNRWYGVARGGAKKLIAAIAGDTVGTFHGLGSIDASLREAGRGIVQLEVKPAGQSFIYVASGSVCTAQEALFHYFGIPLEVLIEPRYWYARHRRPAIVEYSPDRTQVLVRFCSSSLGGEPIVGTCLYIRRDDVEPDAIDVERHPWGAYTIRPSAGANIGSAKAWLVKRKWEPWC